MQREIGTFPVSVRLEAGKQSQPAEGDTWPYDARPGMQKRVQIGN